MKHFRCLRCGKELKRSKRQIVKCIQLGIFEYICDNCGIDWVVYEKRME